MKFPFDQTSLEYSASDHSLPSPHPLHISYPKKVIVKYCWLKKTKHFFTSVCNTKNKGKDTAMHILTCKDVE